MNTKVADVMVANVVTVQPHHSAEHVRKLLNKHGFQVVPVIGPANEPVGILSISDLIRDDHAPGTPVSHFMTKKVFTVPKYEGVHVAARIMRNHSIHHVVVTHEQQIVGILSAFDLLRLVEDHRFVMKNPPTTSKKNAHNDR